MTSLHASLRLAGALGLCTLLGAAPARPTKPLPALVNPFIGTGGHGHTFPGPSAPAGTSASSAPRKRSARPSGAGCCGPAGSPGA